MTDGQLVPAARPAIAGLCLLTLTCYLGLLQAGFVYDDSWTIQHNSTIRSFGNLPALLRGELARKQAPDAWRPLMVISQMVDYRLFGLRPLGYHLHSLAWHLGCVLLVWVLVRRLFRRPLLALTAAAMFAAHPINVEVVAAVNYREDLLAAFFGLAALVALLRPKPVDDRVLRGGWWAAAAAIALLAGLAAKETAAVVPGLYAVVCLGLAGDRGRPRRWLPGAAALCGAVVLYLGWRLCTTGAVSPYPASLPHLPWPTHAEATLRTLAQLVVPVGLSPEYVQPTRAWISAVGVGSMLGILAIIVAAGWIYARGAIIEAVGLLWLLVAWLPTSGVFALPNVRADRYAYLPAVGACMLAAALLGRIPRPALRVAVSALVVGALAIATVIQSGVWRSERTVWQRAVVVAPGSARAWAGLARAAAIDGHLDAARKSATRALSLSPASGDVHLVLANICTRQKRFEEAFVFYARAERLSVRNPGHLYTSWGWALFLAGRTAAAEQKLRQAIATAPGLAHAHANLSRLLARTGRRTAARAALKRALELAPENAARWALPAPD